MSTVGPWSVYRRKSGLEGLLIISKVETIAAVSESDDKTTDEIAANARVLAAGPKMLDCLKRVWKNAETNGTLPMLLLQDIEHVLNEVQT